MVLRVIIDSNRLQSDELRAFLTVSSENFAVLTDYAWMEAYKGNSLRSIQKSMSILREFPEQVIVLRGTKAVCALDARQPGIAQRMQWSKRGQEFRETIVSLRQAETGDLRVIRQILSHGSAADEQLDKILEDMNGLPEAFADMMRSIFSRDEIAIIRTDAPYTSDIISKVFEMANILSANFFANHPNKPRKPSKKLLINTFIYRFAIAMVLYFLGWVREGGQLATASAKLRNDMVDVNFATYGTYFNGVMSDDKRVRQLHLELRCVLKNAGARMPVEYIQPLIEQLKAAGS